MHSPRHFYQRWVPRILVPLAILFVLFSWMGGIRTPPYTIRIDGQWILVSIGLIGLVIGLGLLSEPDKKRINRQLAGIRSAFPRTPRGTFKYVSCFPNAYEHGQRGLRISVTCNVRDEWDIPCTLIAYFYFRSDQPMQDNNGKYCTKDGNVCVSHDFRPTSGNFSLNGVQLFIPYSEFHLSRHEYPLRFRLKIYDAHHKFFARSNPYDFTYHPK